MKGILDKTALGELELRNRIFRSATWMAMADEDGFVTDEITELYKSYAAGGVAAIITGITSIREKDMHLKGMMKFFDDRFIYGHRCLTDAVHKENGIIFLQTAIVDYCTGNEVKDIHPVAVNDLTEAQIKEIIEEFGNAALRAQKAGYDGVQIHAAHHFFLSKFISPIYNQRTDIYGGSRENRARILVDVLKSMREKTGPSFCILIKINGSDFMPGGLDTEDFLTAGKMLEKAGIDAIEVSGNYTSLQGVKAGKNEGYFRKFGEKLKKEIDTPVILVGGHRSVEMMEELLNQTDIEYLSMSRPLTCEPNLISRWADGDLRPAECVSCNMCYRTPGHQCILRSADRVED